MFFIPYDDWKMLFLMKVYRYSEGSFYSTAIAFFEASVLKEVRNLCYLRNDNIKVRKYSFCILYLPFIYAFTKNGPRETTSLSYVAIG